MQKFNWLMLVELLD